MSITRHDPTAILSQAVQHGDTVYLAGIVAKNIDQDVKGQTKQILDDIDRLLAKCGSNKSRCCRRRSGSPTSATGRR